MSSAVLNTGGTFEDNLWLKADENILGVRQAKLSISSRKIVAPRPKAISER
jgi:hypothetical protein